MCGILGVLTLTEKHERGVIERGLQLLAHRGPDGQGIWERSASRPPFVTLGHRRLAIIDLTDAGAQPMTTEDQICCLTYNGEIYNYIELMQELEAKGHRFRSHSDTEVLLRAYVEWGEQCVDRFNGMFAFAIWDERRQELFAARDRFGEKPFHYVWDSKRGFFAFASEIKALLALPEVAAQLDDQALYRYVAFQELAGSEQTLWQGIKRLPNAHTLRLSWRSAGAQLTIRPYWDIQLDRALDVPLDQAARQLAELFSQSVRLRLRADVPVGTSLSGGIDSSAVVCQIHALGAAGGQKTFSARMEEASLDEGPHMKTVLDKTGVEGHEVWPSAAELSRQFEKLCYHQEEPVISTSQFAQHLVMRLASENQVIVLLDGQGADEMLAGYTPYFLARYTDLADRWQLSTLWSEKRQYEQKHAARFPLSFRQLMSHLFPKTYRCWRGKPAEMNGSVVLPWSAMANWWDQDWLQQFHQEQPISHKRSGRDVLTNDLYWDTMHGPLQELLRFGDRNSMAWSRELREPYLDHRMAEFLFTLPPQYKLSGGETKVVLRRALQGLVPDSILRRQDKLGYAAPLKTWLFDGLRSWLDERIEELPAIIDGRLAASLRDDVARQAAANNGQAARTLFSLLTLVESTKQLKQVKTTAAIEVG